MSKKLLLIFFALINVGFLSFPGKASAYNDVPNCSSKFENWVTVDKQKLKSTHPDTVSTHDPVNFTVNLANATIAEGTQIYVAIDNHNHSGQSAYAEGEKDAHVFRSTGAPSQTINFAMKPVGKPATYDVYLMWNKTLTQNGFDLVDNQVCSMGKLNVYDYNLSQVYCSVTSPDLVAYGKEFKASIDLQSQAKGVSYTLVFDDDPTFKEPDGHPVDLNGKLKDNTIKTFALSTIPIIGPSVAWYFTGSKADQNGGQLYANQVSTSLFDTRLNYDPKSSSYASGKLFSTGTHKIGITAYDNETGFLYLCTKKTFQVENEIDGHDYTTASTSKPIYAPGAAGGQGLGPGDAVCSLPQPQEYEQYQQPIEVYVQNSRFIKKDHYVVVLDQQGNVVKQGSAVNADSKEVKLPLPSALDPGTYNIEVRSGTQTVCKAASAVTIKETSPSVDEAGNPKVVCSLPKVTAGASLYLYAKGLDKSQRYGASFNNDQPVSLTVTDSGTASLLLSLSVGAGEYPLSLKDSTGKEVCNLSSIVGENATDTKAKVEEFQSRQCKPNAEDPADRCVSSAGISCDPDNPTDPKTKLTNPGPGILTAIGCIPTQPQALVKSFMRLTAGVAGGIALLLMIAGAFRMITSAGNPDVIKKAQEQFQSAVIGLLFIIFSVLLLQIIGVDILNLPGFGK